MVNALWGFVKAGAHYTCTKSNEMDNVYYVHKDGAQPYVADSEQEALEWAYNDALEQQAQADAMERELNGSI